MERQERIIIYGVSNKIIISTDVNWNGANFILDDFVDQNGDGTNDVENNYVFYVNDTYNSLTITGSIPFSVRKNSTNLSSIISYINNLQYSNIASNAQFESPGGKLYNLNESAFDQIKNKLTHSQKIMVVVEDSGIDHFIRKRSDGVEQSSPQTDSFIISSSGAVLTDILWDFDNITKISFYPVAEDCVTVQNGNFTTRTYNNVSSGKYIKRGIGILRSNVELKNITHKLVEDAHPNSSQSKPKANLYKGFICGEHCSDVTLTNLKVMPHTYQDSKGTYDIRFDIAIDLSLNNVGYICTCSNSSTNSQFDRYCDNCFETYVNNHNLWGVIATNYIKTLNASNCRMNRVDAHQGVHNFDIRDSIIGARDFTLIGSGLANFNNVTVYGSKVKDAYVSTNTYHSNFIDLREDYGSTWDGTIYIEGCNFILPSGVQTANIVDFYNDGTHNFGYKCYYPNLKIRSLTIVDGASPSATVSILNIDEARVGAVSLSRSSKYDFKDRISVYRLERRPSVGSESLSSKGVKLFSNDTYINKSIYATTDKTKFYYSGSDKIKLESSETAEQIAKYNASSSKFEVIYDNTQPTITFQYDQGSLGPNTHSVTINASDANGLDRVLYYWSTSNTSHGPSASYIETTNGATIKKTATSGTYYLWALAFDKALNNKFVCSEPIVFDSIPELSVSVSYNPTGQTQGSVVATITANKELNSLSGWELSNDKKSLSKTYTENKTESVTVTDTDGQTKTVTVTVNNIVKQAPTPTINNATATYDGQNHTVTVGTITGGTLYWKTTGNWTSWNQSKPNFKNVGTYEIQFYVKGEGSYIDSGTITRSVTINKKDLTVQAQNATRRKGEANPDFTFTIQSTGISGETAATSGALTTTATQTSPTGTYPINQGTLKFKDNGSFLANNYNMVFQPGTLTVTDPITYSVTVTKGAGVESYTFSPNKTSFEVGETVLIYFKFSDVLYYDVRQYGLTTNLPVSDIEHDFVEGGHSSGKSAYVRFTMPAEPVSIYMYGDKDFTISYNLNDSTDKPAINNSANPTQYNFNSSSDITIYPPTRDGFVFNGWTGSNGTTPQTNVTIPKGSAGNKSYTANWTANQQTTYATITVKHYKQALDGSYPESLMETSTVRLQVGTDQVVQTRQYTGFTTPQEQTIHVAETNNDPVVYRYARKSYNVSFENTSGKATFPASNDYKYESQVSVTITAANGYTKPVINVGSLPNLTITELGNGYTYKFNMPSQDVVIKASSSPIQYTITYNLDGGSVTGTNPTTYTIETSTFTLNNPTKSGASFDGWIDVSTGNNIGKTVTIAKGSTGNRFFKATWKTTAIDKVSYTVVHSRESLTGTYPSELIETETYEVDDGTSVTPRTKSYTGFTSPSARTITVERGNDNTVTYKYTRNSYSISCNQITGEYTFETEGSYKFEKEVTITITSRNGFGMPEYTTSVALSGATVTTPNDHTKVIKFSMPANNIVFNVSSTPDQYTITYNLNGGNNNPANPGTYTTSSGATIKPPTKNNSTFKGWIYNGNNIGTGDYVIPAGTTGNLTFTATWQDDPTQGSCTVLHKRAALDGSYPESLTETEVVQGTIGETIPINVKHYQGFTSPEARNIVIPSSGTTTVTYTYTRNSYTITINQSSGVTDVVISKNRYLYEEPVEIIFKNRLGYTKPVISSTYTVPSSGIANYTDSSNSNITGYKYNFTMPSSSITFTTENTLINYPITYENISGANNTSNPTQYTVNSTITLSDPTKTGFVFKGWTGSNGNTPQKGVRITNPEIGGLTFRANWEGNRHTVRISSATPGWSIAGMTGTQAEFVTGDEVTLTISANSGYKNPRLSVTANKPSNWTAVSEGETSAKYTFTMEDNDITINATVASISYAITYDLDGGTNNQDNPANFQVAPPSTIRLKEPTKEGYDFVGWTGSNGNTPQKEVTISTYECNGDLHYKANWLGKEHSVALSMVAPCCEVTGLNSTYRTGDTVTFTVTPKAGFKNPRANINENKPSDWTAISEGETSAKYSFTVGNNNLTILVTATPIEYAITYDLDGGTNNQANPTSYTIEPATTITIKEPTKEGYDFVGWTGSNGNTPQKEVVILTSENNGELHYKANWLGKEHSVALSMVAPCCEVTGLNSTYRTGDKVTFTVTAKNGFKNPKANINENKPSDWTVISEGETSAKYSFTVGNNNLTILVTATPIEYAITYDLDGGTNNQANPTSYTIEPATTITIKEPTKEGYDFVGWTGSNGNTPQKEVVILTSENNGELHYKANWLGKEHEIAINMTSPWCEVTGLDGTHRTGDKVTFTVTAKPGFKNPRANINENKPSDWTAVSEGETSSTYTFTLGNSNYVILVTATPIEYTITYNLDGGTNNPDNPTTYVIDPPREITLKEPTRTGYRFLGWTGSNGTTPQKEVTITLSEIGGYTFNANWEEAIYTYYVKHIREDLNGLFTDESLIEVETLTTKYGEVTPATRSYTGFIAPERQTVLIETDDQVITYEYRRQTYSVSVVAGEGISSVIGEGNYKFGQRVNISYTYHTGYENGRITTPGYSNSFNMPAQNLSLTAEASQIIYSIEYDLRGGTNNPENPYSYTINSPTIEIKDPTRPGYNFIGWTGSNGTLGSVSPIIPTGSTGDRLFIANWEVPAIDFPDRYDYTVEYYQQTVSGAYPTYPTEKIRDTAVANEIIEAPLKTYNGFITPELQRVKIVEQDMVIKYYYSRDSFELSIIKGDGVKSVSGEGTYTYGARVMLSAEPENENDTVVFLDGGVLIDDNYRMPARNVTIKALVLNPSGPSNPDDPDDPEIPDIQRYTITYDLDGGENNPHNPPYYTTLDEFDLFVPTKDGHEFAGWTGSNGSTPQKEVRIEKGSTGDKHYKANWKELSDEEMYYYVQEEYFEKLDGTFPDKPDRSSKNRRQKNTVVDAVPRKYEGFVLPESQRIFMDQDGIVVRFYYARETYRITFEKGPGVKEIRGASVDVGTLKYEAPIEATAIIDSGYKELIWLENGTKIDKLYETMPAKDLKLTARGVPIEYQITYELNGGKQTNNPTKYTIEDEIIIENPVREEYVFIGWTGTNGDTPQENLMILKGSQGDMHFIANWQKAEDAWQLNVSFDNTLKIQGKVTVYINSNIKLKPLDGWTLSSNECTLSKEYTKNKDEDVTVENIRGERNRITFKITNIDNEPPLGSVYYKYLSDGTEQVTLVVNEEIEDIEGWTTQDHLTFTKIYSANAVEDIVLKDLAGNESKQTITVDKVVGRINNLQSNLDDTVGGALGKNATKEQNEARGNMPFSGAKKAIGLLLIIPLTIFAIYSYRKSKNNNWY